MAVNFDKLPRYIVRELEKGTTRLQRGSSGQQVRQVQEWLCYHQLRTSIDGAYGPATARRIAQFQEEAQLPKSGRVTNATWRALVAPMREALAEPQGIGSLPPEQVIGQVAQQHLTAHPIEIGGPNGGPWVRLYCEGNDGPDWAWCAGFVSLVIAQAHFYMNSKAPLKGSVSCDSLASQARESGRFHWEKDITSGKVNWAEFGGCCVFLRRRTPTDWVHTGFAFDAEGDQSEITFRTIEGNTNDEGSREGFEACERFRSVYRANYDFIRLGMLV